MKKSTTYHSLKMVSVICLLSVIILSNSSCSKSSITPRIIRDTNYYFTLNMNNKTHTTYSWISATSPGVADTPYAYISNSVDSTGLAIWTLDINVDPEWTDIYRRGHFTIAANITLTKSGNFLGEYKINGPDDLRFLNVESKDYLILRNDAVFTVNYISPPGTEIPVVEGTFRCTILETITNTLFPATGSFRLRVKA